MDAPVRHLELLQSRVCYPCLRDHLPRGEFMSITWRFYIGEDGLWRWEQLSEESEVVARSRSSYDSYERCVAAARDIGYVFEAAPARRQYTPSLYGRAAAGGPGNVNAESRRES